MKRYFVHTLFAAGIVGAMVSGPGCMNLDPRPDPTVHYALSGPDPASAEGTGIRMGVRRIEMPAYLARTQIVTRRGENQIVRAEFHRWADGFESSVKRAVGEHLAAQNGVHSVLVYPWIGSQEFDVTVKIWVQRFEGADDGTVRLDASWQLEEPANPKEYPQESTHLAGQWTPADYGSLVAEMDRLLGQLAAEITGDM